jgi:hypothetical protein
MKKSVDIVTAIWYINKALRTRGKVQNEFNPLGDNGFEALQTLAGSVACTL